MRLSCGPCADDLDNVRLVLSRLLIMRRLRTFIVLLCASCIVAVAWAGHELPIYPSFYPHQIDIQTLPPEQAPAALTDVKLHAFIGRGVRFPGTLPNAMGTVDSLGAYIMVRVNPQAPFAHKEASLCAATKTVIRAMAKGDLVLHPYPVTPFHGDYLYHIDLAEAEKAKVSGAPDGPPIGDLKIKASGSIAQSHREWLATGADWDLEVFEVNAADLVAAATHATNGWIAPPWLKTGWFHAERLLADAISDPEQKERAHTDVQRLMNGVFNDLVERVNLERDLVTALTSGCHVVVAGYTVKHEYFNDEFSAGIENISYDSITGLDSPMFLRTVKLKDYPWNGWLGLGIGTAPTAAWNPIGGMTDPFGRLMWAAIGDPALMPAPNDDGWMLNRIADLPANQRSK
jgi:hypothetical protein